MKTHESKYLSLKETLLGKINTGELRPGDQLPPCRELAREYQVSYLTATKAINLLAADGYIQASQGRGSFVRQRAPDEQLRTHENKRVILCAPPIVHDQVDLFLREGKRMFFEQGWDVEIEQPRKMRDILSLVKRPDSYVLLFGYQFSNYNDRYLIATHGRGRIIMLGERFDFFGITSISSDNSHIMRMALDFFQSKGRSKIGLICANLAHVDELERLAALRCYYRTLYKEHLLEKLLVDLNLKQFTVVADQALKTFEEHLNSGTWNYLDAVIAPEVETAQLLCRFLKSHRFRIPEDIAVIAINNISGHAETKSPLSCIDTNFQAQVRISVEAILKLAKGQGYKEILYTCEPSLVLRSTTP